uniref:Uncharacterized protein n=1 Tax=Plectus sambesii TaxID=2011161 RepID=A0A914VQL6_9BILA
MSSPTMPELSAALLSSRSRRSDEQRRKRSGTTPYQCRSAPSRSSRIQLDNVLSANALSALSNERYGDIDAGGVAVCHLPSGLSVEPCKSVSLAAAAGSDCCNCYFCYDGRLSLLPCFDW